MFILPHQNGDGGFIFFDSSTSHSLITTQSIGDNTPKTMAFAYLDALANTGQISTIPTTNTTGQSSSNTTTTTTTNTYYYTQPSLYRFDRYCV